jgi:heptosyltransferase-2
MSRTLPLADPHTILVRAPNWLGDVVMSTPGFRALRRAYPAARIVGHLPEHLVPLLSGSSDFDELWPLRSRHGGIRAMRQEARRIAAERFDLGVVIPESISSALLMRWGRVGRVTGYARDGLRRWLLHREVPAPREWGRRRLVSRERFVLGLVAAVGARSVDTRLELRVTTADESRLAQALAERTSGLAEIERSPPIVLAPGASFGPAKCWPVASFAELGDRLARHGERVVLIGSIAERERANGVRAAMKSEVLDLTGRLDLGALKALLARTRLVVSNDAGARHIATALSVPSVVFFGPTDVAKTDENLALVEVLEGEHACRPCYQRQCPIDHRCLVEIGVGEAEQAVQRRLESAAVQMADR